MLASPIKSLLLQAVDFSIRVFEDCFKTQLIGPTSHKGKRLGFVSLYGFIFFLRKIILKIQIEFWYHCLVDNSLLNSLAWEVFKTFL